MNFFSKLFFCIVICTTLNFAIIIEHAHFGSIFDYVTPTDYNKKTIVIVDIDNTLATLAGPFQMLGSDTWVNYEIAKRFSQGMTIDAALAEVLPLYFDLVRLVNLRPVEPHTPEIIKQLQDAGITVVACTLRSIEISDRTVEQLQAIGIDFTHSAFGIEEIIGQEIRFRYKNGIIFCHGLNKGPAFKAVLDYFNHTPAKIIFIDDKEKYLHQIKAVLHPDIEFIGIRYSHLDEKVAQFDQVLAQQELQEYLKNI